MGVDLKQSIKKFEKTLRTSAKRMAEEGGFGAQLPDARYKTKLESCVIGRAKGGKQRWQIEYVFAVNAGDFEGEKIRKYQAIETEDDQVWVHRDLARFGAAAPESVDELIKIVDAINEAKPEVRVSLVTKDSGQFSYIDRVLETVDFGDLASEGGADTGDDGSGEPEAADDAPADTSGDEGGAELEVGMRVRFESSSGDMLTGKIVQLLEDTSEVKVKVGEKTHRVHVDDLFEAKPEEKPKEQKPKGMKLRKR